MVVMATSVKDRVRDVISGKPLRPTELVQELHSEFYAREVEGALSQLLDEGSVVFGSDRILRILDTVTAA
jgi:hypothetical protein